MKPFEEFLDKMNRAAKLVQAKDPMAANEVIQNALRAAGLLQPLADSPTARAAPDMVDVNAPPDWTIAKERKQPQRKPVPDAKRSRAPKPDPRAPGEFIQGSFSGPAGSRRYKLYIPSTPAMAPRPLVVMLHGCTQGPDDFAAGTEMNALAEQYGCLVLYPEQSRKANATACWNWFEVPHQARDSGEPSLIAGMTKEVIERWQGDPARVYVAGLSAGGAMAAIMGAAYPEIYAAVGVHSGLPVGKARDLITGLAAMKRTKSGASKAPGNLRQRVPIIVFHGDKDDVVHAENGKAVLEQFLRPAPTAPQEELRRTSERGKSAGGRAYTKVAMVDSTGRTVAEHWELHGAGHAWAGGSGRGSYTDPSGPSASAEFLRFFLSQPRVQ